MVIMTPLTVDAFANAKNSDNFTKFPSFLAFGFRNNIYPVNGLDIAAATKKQKHHVIANSQKP